jgi:hypothetical protein
MKNFVELRFPQPSVRQALLSFFAESLVLAHRTNATSWSVTDTAEVTKLNVGQLAVLHLDNCDVRLMVHAEGIQHQLAQCDVRILENVKWIDGVIWVRVCEPDLPGKLTNLKAAHHRLVRSAATKQPRVREQARRIHSEAFVEYLLSQGLQVVQPAYVNRVVNTGSSAAMTSSLSNTLQGLSSQSDTGPAPIA